MMKLFSIALTVVFLAGAASLAQAQEYRRRAHEERVYSGREIRERLQEHEHRIREGVRTGDLTRSEAADLRSKEEFYRAKLEDFLQKNNGKITENEERSLERSLDAMSGQIHSSKQNNDVR